MSKKPLGKDKFGVQKVMRVKDYFGDATGQFALNAMSTLVGPVSYTHLDVYKRQIPSCVCMGGKDCAYSCSGGACYN